MLTLNDLTVQSYLVHSGILAVKMLGMASLTSRARMSKKVFANDEDAKMTNGVVKHDDADIERVRRAHRNDLENIPVFWFLGALYLTTAPEADWAVMLFRIYTASRILHSIVYAIKPLPQPARALSYLVPYIIKWYMGVKVISHYIVGL